MKKMGNVRKIDELGRVVLPIEMRRQLNWKVNDEVIVTVEENSILLRKKEPCCVICGKTAGLRSFHNQYLCLGCIKKITQSFPAENTQSL